MAERLFACHKSTDGKDVVCAGFLARGADHNLTIRLAYIQGELTFERDRDGGLALFEGFREMAVANGVDPTDPVLGPCR